MDARLCAPAPLGVEANTGKMPRRRWPPFGLTGYRLIGIEINTPPITSFSLKSRLGLSWCAL